MGVQILSDIRWPKNCWSPWSGRLVRKHLIQPSPLLTFGVWDAKPPRCETGGCLQKVVRRSNVKQMQDRCKDQLHAARGHQLDGGLLGHRGWTKHNLTLSNTVRSLCYTTKTRQFTSAPRKHPRMIYTGIMFIAGEQIPIKWQGDTWVRGFSKIWSEIVDYLHRPNRDRSLPRWPHLWGWKLHTLHTFLMMSYSTVKKNILHVNCFANFKDLYSFY